YCSTNSVGGVELTAECLSVSAPGAQSSSTPVTLVSLLGTQQGVATSQACPRGSLVKANHPVCPAVSSRPQEPYPPLQPLPEAIRIKPHSEHVTRMARPRPCRSTYCPGTGHT